MVIDKDIFKHTQITFFLCFTFIWDYPKQGLVFTMWGRQNASTVSRFSLNLLKFSRARDFRVVCTKVQWDVRKSVLDAWTWLTLVPGKTSIVERRGPDRQSARAGPGRLTLARPLSRDRRWGNAHEIVWKDKLEPLRSQQGIQKGLIVPCIKMTRIARLVVDSWKLTCHVSIGYSRNCVFCFYCLFPPAPKEWPK